MQVDPTKPLQFTNNELKQFIGILFVMPIVKSLHDYWAEKNKICKDH